jgi:ubiquinone/menaquinone biosynthesis C-methylase UbiE
MFDNPLRLLIHQPGKMLRDYVKPGSKVLDFGCGLGFFSIAMAKMVGEGGLVIAADLQDVMLQGLMKRARRAGVADRIRPHLTAPDRIGLEDQVDFAIACWVMHETPDVDAAFGELASALVPGGRLFVIEPKSHASEEEFDKLLASAAAAGLSEVTRPRSAGSRAVVLERLPASP